MSSSKQILALIKSRSEGDEEAFYSIALQIAASGHGKVAAKSPKNSAPRSTRPVLPNLAAPVFRSSSRARADRPHPIDALPKDGPGHLPQEYQAERALRRLARVRDRRMGQEPPIVYAVDDSPPSWRRGRLRQRRSNTPAASVHGSRLPSQIRRSILRSTNCLSLGIAATGFGQCWRDDRASWSR